MFMNAAYAQDVIHSSIKKQEPIHDAQKILSRLEPISYEFIQTDALGPHRGMRYDIDPNSVRQTFPSALRSETVWNPAGKNVTDSHSYERVELELLVPILVSALQEQGAELVKLRSELEGLKNNQKQKSQKNP